ncbi:hypothetical protein LZ32DRAFT_189257 [Colletotrichum eremochloae]|nr:hypothetical protein LZ32DRAFT_189257 [Colletotrichum eremochloae]
MQQGQKRKGSILRVAPKPPIAHPMMRRGGVEAATALCPVPIQACQNTPLLVHFQDISFPPPRPDFFSSSFPFFNNNFVQSSLSLLYVGRIVCCHSLFTFGYSPSFPSHSLISSPHPLGIPACIHSAVFSRPFVNTARYYVSTHRNTKAQKYTRTSRNKCILYDFPRRPAERRLIPCVRPFCSAPVRSHEDLWLR